MTEQLFPMTVGDGVCINYDDGYLELSPRDHSRPGITFRVQRTKRSQAVRLVYDAEDGILFFNWGSPAVVAASVQCTAEKAKTLSRALDLRLRDA